MNMNMNTLRKKQGSYLAMFRHFFSTVSSSARGKVLLTIWGSFVVGVYLLKSPKRHKKNSKSQTNGHGHSHGKIINNKQQPDKTSPPPVTLTKVGQFIWATIKPHLLTLFGAKLCFYLLLLTYRIRVTVKIATITGRLGSYFGSRRWDAMFDGQVTFGLWCMVASATTSLMKYMEKSVALDFRELLYKKLSTQYYSVNKQSGGSVMYGLGHQLMDCPSRLTTDLKTFSDLVAHEFGHIVKPIIDMSYLTLDLTAQIGPLPLTLFLSFFWWSKNALSKTRNVLPLKLSELAKNVSEYEAKLSSNAQHVHNYREEISLSQGQENDSKRTKTLFRKLSSLSRVKNMYECSMDCVRSYLLKYGGAMTAFSMLIPNAYVNEGSSSSEDGTANYLLRSTLLMSLANAVKDLSDSVNCLNDLLGVGSRLLSLSTMLNEEEIRINNSSKHTNTTRLLSDSKSDESDLQHGRGGGGVVERKAGIEYISLCSVNVSVPLASESTATSMLKDHADGTDSTTGSTTGSTSGSIGTADTGLLIRELTHTIRSGDHTGERHTHSTKHRQSTQPIQSHTILFFLLKICVSFNITLQQTKSYKNKHLTSNASATSLTHFYRTLFYHTLLCMIIFLCCTQ